MKPEVVILGGGPGAIFSFFGALKAGFFWEEVQIWSPALTYPSGAFWLHEVPMNMFPSDRIEMHLLGTAERYTQNQWGEPYPSSADKYSNGIVEEVAYNPHVVLPQMWDMCNRREIDKKWSHEEIVSMAEAYSFVIQTFPTDPLVREQAAKYKFPVITTTLKKLEGNRCIYNGTKDISWVRCTIAFGRCSTEFPMNFPVEMALSQEESIWGKRGEVNFVPDLHPNQKPISDPVVGRRKNILLTGRWTVLNRRSLSHHSMGAVEDFLRPRM